MEETLSNISKNILFIPKKIFVLLVSAESGKPFIFHDLPQLNYSSCLFVSSSYL